MNIAQTIVDSLGRRIISGELHADGPALVEQDIISEFGASRNVVREAVKTLAGKNLVRSERRNGTIVQPAGEWNLLDTQVLGWMLSEETTNEALMEALSELRLIIEPEAAALAATRATTKQILRLFDCFEDMQANAYDADVAIQHDVRFHETLAEACGNPLLRSLSRSIGLLLHANFQLAIQVDNAFIRNLEDHRKIAEAIQNRDPEAARAATIELLSKNQKDLDEMKQAEGAMA